jgi:hypothetical protein
MEKNSYLILGGLQNKSGEKLISKHRMPERLSGYKKYHIAGTKIYDNIRLGA